MIDVGRGNNAQTGTQAAVDALALAGARELDREPGARDRARLAMAEVTNTVGLLETVPGGGAQTLQYTGASDPLIEVTFLSAIPPSDDDPINATWITNNTATSDANAEFVHVRVVLEDFDSLFRRIASGITNDVRIGATATATNRQGTTCELPALQLCNPAPRGAGGYAGPVEAFRAGYFHARLFGLRNRGGSDRGNFGFVDPAYTLYGPSSGPMGNAEYADNFLADRNRLSCAVVNSGDMVRTTPGTRSSLNAHFNTRFGLYESSGGGTRNQGFPSDAFVRKGYSMSGAGCTGTIDRGFEDMLTATSYTPANINTSNPNRWRFGSRNINAMGYPANYSMEDVGVVTFGGQTPPTGTTYVWPVDYYLQFNYAGHGTILNDIRTRSQTARQSLYGAEDAVRNPNVNTPSRHDVYLYELQNRATLVDRVSGSQDVRNPSCTGEPQKSGARYMKVALVDCVATPPEGRDTLPPVAYATIFLTNPIISSSDRTIWGEIINITPIGEGLSETDLRDEAHLVR
jgi:hypothetical protein